MDAEAVVARTIREVRRSKNWRLADLASACGIGLTVLSKIETGGRRITVNDVHAIAAGLGVHPADLMGYKDDLAEAERRAAIADTAVVDAMTTLSKALDVLGGA